MLNFLRLLSFSSGVLAATLPLELHSYVNPLAFDNGDYGSYPVETFVSSHLTPPRLAEMEGSPPDDDGMHIFFSPRGHQVKQQGPTILDEAGNLVWMSYEYDQVYALMSQEYNGERYITFWSGNDGIGGHGAGTYIILDSSYKEVRRYGAAGGLDGDLHEFRLTEDGTALITVYQVIQYDLTSVGGQPDGFIWDSLFQEIDITSGNLLFQWRASDNIAMASSFKGIGGAGTLEGPYDFFHINSVEKDSHGNYMVSSRYMHSVTYIDGKTGKTIWILGGKENMFKDLSEGRATDFEWQHDARWQTNHTHVSLFDNGAEVGHYTSDKSRGLYIRVDTEKMEAELTQEYINPQEIICSSQGSMQILPNGNVLLSYGYTAAWTEFDKNGTVIWDVHYGAKVRFESGDAQSYRVLKFPWVGRPSYPPSFATWGRRGYVSWNGATEVAHWVLEDSDSEDGTYHPVETFRKRGFETGFDLDLPGKKLKKHLRVSGIDKDGKTLGTSEPLEYNYKSNLAHLSSAVIPLESYPSESHASFSLVTLIAGMCLLSGLVGALIASGGSVRHRMRIGRGGYRPLKSKQWN